MTKPPAEPRFMSPVVVNDARTGKPVAVMKEDPEGRYVHWTDINTPSVELMPVDSVAKVREALKLAGAMLPGSALGVMCANQIREALALLPGAGEGK